MAGRQPGGTGRSHRRFDTGSRRAGAVPRSTIATAVRYSLEEVTARAPGNSVEVRVPPFGVTQCVEGPRHTRGTPPNVIECDAATWLAMVSGQLSWADAVAAGRVAASGLRADLSGPPAALAALPCSGAPSGQPSSWPAPQPRPMNGMPAAVITTDPTLADAGIPAISSTARAASAPETSAPLGGCRRPAPPRSRRRSRP